MKKDELVALVQKQISDEAAMVAAKYQPILDGISALEMPSDDSQVNDLKAQVMDLQSKLDAANVHLAEEIALELADQEKIGKLGEKISNALAALA